MSAAVAPVGLTAGARPAAAPRTCAVEMVVPTLVAAGMEMVVANLALALAGRGHRVGVTCLEAGGALAERLTDAGLAVSVAPTPGTFANFRAPALARHFARRRPDVVHSHSGVWGKAAVAARRAGVPGVVHTVHGLHEREPWYGPALKRWAGRHTDATVAVSAPLHDYLLRVARLPAARVHTVINGVDVRRFAPGPRTGTLAARLGLPNARRLVGTVARLAPVKNQALLVEAFARVAARHPDADLVFVGTGELREALGARAAALGVAGRVHFPGAVADTPPAYRDLDVFALPSFAEGTSMSVLEAMSTGLPVVATAVGGTPHLLDGGRCGLLVPSGDADALAAALDRLLGDRGAAQSLGAAARARAEADFSEDAMLDAYERFYARAAGARAAGRGGR